MNISRTRELEKIALEARKDVVRMVGVARARGLNPSLASVDLLVYLYWEYMAVYPQVRNRPERDRFVLSKMDVTSALYACLARLGFFDREELWSYRRLGAMLQGYPDIRTPGVDAPSGVLGGGIGIAAGLCLALRLSDITSRVFCLMGDYEMGAGGVWESISAAVSDHLGNLVLIVDSKSQDESIRRRLEMLGWVVREADGHDFSSIERAFGEMDCEKTFPKALIAHTTDCGVGGIPSYCVSDSAQPLSNDDIDSVLARLESKSRDIDFEQ
ncbi:MAG: transketolase [Synergistaceae bacterium]|jgi:transketolase|nr:transketolase [Synergistaceae bacterium]